MKKNHVMNETRKGQGFFRRLLCTLLVMVLCITGTAALPAQAALTATAEASTSLKKVTGVTTTLQDNGSVKVSWNKVSGAKGYQIYRKTGKNGTWKLVRTIRSGSKTSFTTMNLKSGKTYYYKVRAYQKTSSGKSYGSCSKAVRYTVDASASTGNLTITNSVPSRIKL